MRLSGPTFWSMAVGAVAIAASAGTDVISNHQAVNQIVVALAGLSLAGLTLNQFWPQPLEAVVGRIKARGEPRMPDGYMPLQEASDRLLDETLNMPLRIKAITHGGKTLNGAWAWLGHHMVRKGLTIYGRHPATKIWHPIPVEHFSVAGIRGGAAEMVRDGFTTYSGLAVRRADFEARLEQLKQVD